MLPEWFVVLVRETGKPVRFEELFVLYNAACERLAQAEVGTTAIFHHAGLSGTIRRGEDGKHLTQAGTFFHADLGPAGLERWTCDFFVHAENPGVISPETELFGFLPDPNGLDYTGGRIVHPAAAQWLISADARMH